MIAPAVGSAQRFQDATDRCFATTAEWTNRVEVADIDTDGDLDVVFANGGNGATAGSPEAVRAWTNQGSWATAGSRCTEVTASLGVTALSRVVRAVDIDRDDDVDLLVGGSHQTQLKLLVRGPTGWTDGTVRLPQQLTSVGDIEAGDVDNDGDLDLVIADWGVDPPTPAYAGGRTRLYLNNGSGTFTDATATRMPDRLVKWSQDLELVDIDRDWDLDVIVACSYCTASEVFINDGGGSFAFTDFLLPPIVTQEIEPVDLDRDGDLDLVAIDADAQLREHILINDGGAYVDRTSMWLADAHNPANTDDSAMLPLDVGGDGRVALLIGGRGSDRLLVQIQSGTFTSEVGTPDDTASTLALGGGDLNGDGRIDVVNAQGDTASPDKLQLAATSQVQADVDPPRVTVEVLSGAPVDGKLRAHVIDLGGPSGPHGLERVWLEHDGFRAAFESPPIFANTDMTWSGGTLWTSPVIHSSTNYQVCARDRNGNQGCSEWIYVFNGPSDGFRDFGTSLDGGFPGSDGGFPITPGDQPGGCCDAGPSSGRSSLLLALATVGLVRRRRRR